MTQKIKFFCIQQATAAAAVALKLHQFTKFVVSTLLTLGDGPFE